MGKVQGKEYSVSFAFSKCTLFPAPQYIQQPEVLLTPRVRDFYGDFPHMDKPIINSVSSLSPFPWWMEE